MEFSDLSDTYDIFKEMDLYIPDHSPETLDIHS